MNYIKIYKDLINRAESRDVIEHKERHHIIPRSLGGSDKKSNIAILTPREHYIAHYLLCKIYPNEPKMAFALWFMSQKNSSITLTRKYKITSRAYEYSRKLYSSMREGYVHSEETKLKMRGNKHTEESKILFSKIQKDLIINEKAIGIDRSERFNSKFRWWNNGITEFRYEIAPDSSWKIGRLDRNFRWWNDGNKSTMSKYSPGPNWVLGRIYKGIVK